MLYWLSLGLLSHVRVILQSLFKELVEIPICCSWNFISGIWSMWVHKRSVSEEVIVVLALFGTRASVQRFAFFIYILMRLFVWGNWSHVWIFLYGSQVSLLINIIVLVLLVHFQELIVAFWYHRSQLFVLSLKCQLFVWTWWLLLLRNLSSPFCIIVY